MSFEKLQGSVERITYHNPENGFSVLRIKVKHQQNLFTVTGCVFNILSGSEVLCEGSWVNHKKHGLQFSAQHIQVILPSTQQGIRKYLSSGLIKGIGRHFAELLVSTFGEEIFDIIENQPQKLLQVEGIGTKRQRQIIQAWASQKIIKDIMVFLQSYGVSTGRAIRIYKTYGDQAIAIVLENPYRLARDIYGIGFKTADQLAMKLGIEKTSLIRARAGLHYVLLELSQEGHCASEIKDLMVHATKLLEVSEEIVVEAIQKEIAEQQLIQESFDPSGEQYIYLPSLYEAETFVAERLKELSRGTTPWPMIDSDKAITWVEQKTKLSLSSSQKQAVTLALKEKVLIITGGPGVGKTTIINSIVRVLQAKSLRVSLCAPTGRASKRLSELTHQEAKTIHRLLGFQPGAHRFKYSLHHPLLIDFLIVDEASMIDVLLMSQLLKAIPVHAALLIVGDVDQLPSVGPGTVLADLIASDVITTVRLTEIFRQAVHSHIIVNAHRINQGQFPLWPSARELSDFYFIEAKEPDEIYEKLIHIVSQRIPKTFHVDPVEDIQVLTPMRIGKLGTRTLNVALQSLLNRNLGEKINRFGFNFSVGDKVIQNTNNYDDEIFNGDIGYIRKVDLVSESLFIQFTDREVEYEFNELDQISLAYAVTIHKSQGSEYPIVVIPLTTQHYMMLARNLLYTGVTRGKKLVVLIGQKKALAITIHNEKKSHNQRITRLKERLIKL